MEQLTFDIEAALGVAPDAAEVRGCSVGDCDRPHKARGWCGTHYARWRTHGDPEATAVCAGCGGPRSIGSRYLYCNKYPECRRMAKSLCLSMSPEAQRLHHTRYYAANVERVLAQATRWKAEHPDEARAIINRYKAREDRQCCWPDCDAFALKTQPFCRRHKNEYQSARYVRKRAGLHERQGGLCPAVDRGGCGLPLGSADGNHVDHLIPRVRNGPDRPWNLQLMHPECNLRKSDSIVPAAVILASEHGIALTPPGRPRRAAA